MLVDSPPGRPLEVLNQIWEAAIWAHPGSLIPAHVYRGQKKRAIRFFIPAQYAEEIPRL